MHWAAPNYAWLLLLILPAWTLLRRAASSRERILMDLMGHKALPPPAALVLRWGPGILLAIAFLLVIVALCRPQWGQVTTLQTTRGLDILIALDVSRSMLADDQHPNRLEAAKSAVSGLLPRLRGDRIGLVAFAGSAFLVCPLTTDYDTFAEVLAEVGPETLPLGGTSLASALREAKRAYGDKSEGGRVLILMTDGEDHGDEADTRSALQGTGIVAYGMAIGTREGGLIPLPGGGFLKDRSGSIVKSRQHIPSLQAIAMASGARQLDLSADPKALETLYAKDLANMQRHDVRGTRREWVERFQIPLAFALCLLFFESFINGRRHA